MCDTAANSFEQQASSGHARPQGTSRVFSQQQDSRSQLGVPELVSAQVAATPNAIAITHGARSLSYQELDRRADRVAHALRSLGVGPDVVVGLYLDRSIAMIVGALGILKAGGAYLPLDPSYPRDRLALLWKDAQAPILVTGKCMAGTLPLRTEHVVEVNPEGQVALDQIPKPLPVQAKASNLAYVIYTSGSTGQPKGVEITRGGLLNLVRWHHRAFGITPNDRASHLASLGFDAAVWELWPYLTRGASVR